MKKKVICLFAVERQTEVQKASMLNFFEGRKFFYFFMQPGMRSSKFIFDASNFFYEIPFSCFCKMDC